MTKYIHIPLLSNDRKSIEKARSDAKKAFPKARKYTYKKPEFVELLIDGEDRSFWTFPEILVTKHD